MTYEGTKSVLARINPTSRNNAPLLPTPIIHALASSTGELVSCLILTPAEVLKQNAQMVQKSIARSSSSGGPKTQVFDGNATMLALRKFRHSGQLWRGYTALAARNLPFTAMQFPLFEYLRSTIQTARTQSKKATNTLLETATITAIAAGAAGSIAAVITTPIDVVKTRIMLGVGATDRRAARSGWAVGKEIWRTDGVRGLFRGGALRGLWTAAGSGLYLAAYESGKRYLEERRHE